MAKIISDDKNTSTTIASYSMWLIGLVGALLGLAFWGLTVIIGNYMIQPIFCHSANTVSACLQATSISGDIATILIATIGVIVMIALKMVRPLIIAVASAAVLWGLAAWTNGLGWAESIAWSIFLYAIAYILFSWIARYLLIKPVLVTMLTIIIIARIAIAL